MRNVLKQVFVVVMVLVIMVGVSAYSSPKPINFLNFYSVFFRGDAGEPVAVASSTPLPVTMGGSTTFNLTMGSPSFVISNFPATQAVSVSNFPASYLVEILNFPATQAVTVGNLPATQAVTVVNFPATTAVSNFPASTSVNNFPAVSTGSYSFQNTPVTYIQALESSTTLLLSDICSFTPPCEIWVTGETDYYLYGGATSTLSSVQQPALLEAGSKLNFKPAQNFNLTFSGLATQSQVAVVVVPLTKDF